MKDTAWRFQKRREAYVRRVGGLRLTVFEYRGGWDAQIAQPTRNVIWRMFGNINVARNRQNAMLYATRQAWKINAERL